MMKKVIKIKDLDKNSSILDDLEYWLGKSAEERISTVEYLRRQYHGTTARLQRVVRVIERS